MIITLAIIATISCVISGMGIGGGSIFILLSTIFNLFEQREAQTYNLIMFIAIGISITIYNLKKGSIDKKKLKKLIIPTCLGSIVGVILVKYIDQKILKYLFYGFLLIIGSYEIITSLKSIKDEKNNKGRS